MHTAIRDSIELLQRADSTSGQDARALIQRAIDRLGSALQNPQGDGGNDEKI